MELEESPEPLRRVYFFQHGCRVKNLTLFMDPTNGSQVMKCGISEGYETMKIVANVYEPSSPLKVH